MHGGEGRKLPSPSGIPWRSPEYPVRRAGDEGVFALRTATSGNPQTENICDDRMFLSRSPIIRSGVA